MTKSEIKYDQTKQINFGLMPSPEDSRDIKYQYVSQAPANLPKKYMLKTHPVKDQGKPGTCVGMAGAKIQECDNLTRGEDVELSALYLYAHCKAIDGLPVEGTDLRTAMKVLTTEGICKEELYPYQDTEDTMQLKFPKISAKATNDGRSRRCKGYARIHSLQEVKEAIYNENGVMCGVLVTSSFKDSKTGVVGTPDGWMLGMHAIPLVGWDDERVVEFIDGDNVKHQCKGVIYFQNSWGEEWGEKGFGMIPYDYFDLQAIRKGIDVKLVEECWTTFHLESPDGKDDPDVHKRHNGIVPESNPQDTNTFSKDKVTIQFELNSVEMLFDGQVVRIPQPAQIIKNSMFVPLKGSFANLGKVSFNNKTKVATIELDRDKILNLFK